MKRARVRTWLIIVSISLFFANLTNCYSQQLSADTWLVRNLSILQDLGLGWDISSNFKPFTTQDFLSLKSLDSNTEAWLSDDINSFTSQLRHQFEQSSPEVTGMLWAGLLNQAPAGSNKAFDENSHSLYLVSQLWFREHFSAEWYIRSTSDAKSLDHFTAVPRKERRLGQNAGEFDQASLSYNDEWITLRFGRGRQVWGTGLNDNLILSASSAAYDYFMAKFKYKGFTGTFFTGFLESVIADGDNNIRYISGHGLQYSNKRNFLFSLSEISIYYGPDRPLDFSYLNPLIPHVEAELDDRENDHRGNFSNAVWVASVDWLLPSHFRLSASYLIDEFQIDQADRNQKRPDATGLKLRFAKSILGQKGALTFFSEYNRVGTFTFRHEKPFTAFAARGLPLGVPEGSDFYKVSCGLRWVAPFRLIFTTKYSMMEQGANNLLDNLFIPYDEFIKTDFPSGNTKTTKSIDINLLYAYRSNLDFQVDYRYLNQKTDFASEGSAVIFSINYHRPFFFSF